MPCKAALQGRCSRACAQQQYVQQQGATEECQQSCAVGRRVAAVHGGCASVPSAGAVLGLCQCAGTDRPTDEMLCQGPQAALSARTQQKHQLANPTSAGQAPLGSQQSCAALNGTDRAYAPGV